MRSGSPLTLLISLLLLAAQAGCVSWRSLQPVPPSVSHGRRLARQGVAAMEVGQWDEAEELLREAIEKTPDDPEARCKLAEVLQRRGANAEALEHMAVASHLDAADPWTAVRAGELLLEAEDADRAIQQANRAIRLDQSLAAAWTLRGQAYAAQGDTTRAMADMQRALLLAPNEAGLLLESAKIYHQRQQHHQCLATLHRLQDVVGPGGESSAMLELEGRTYLALGRPRMATERLALAAERGSTNPELQTLLAQAQQSTVELSQLPKTPGGGQRL
ncbi:tetratricopeptide repeat protein [Aeoliella mucimassa]|uniref:Cellulose synthase subunit BcsC n=1 Tax=Aeoliella mucimassa TaxID=2527972 RepID=A0A518AV99_9BACT|nr:tetratricopeptide repeat protein [Aeoliella mucimassa]QDU58641.1 cellulose synthase subunit BcsC [Aeoliella mucimassa]